MAICGRPATAGGASNAKLQFTYTGDWTKRTDGVVELRSTGMLVFLEPAVIDIFCVGGGGKGGQCGASGGSGYYAIKGGGGGGYTQTLKKVNVEGTYPITIGGGSTAINTDGGTTSFGNIASAAGGKSGGYSTASSATSTSAGSDGGSGGGGATFTNENGGAGGSDGDNGESGGGQLSNRGGYGQSNSTREFGEAAGKLYAGGGGGGRAMHSSNPIASAGGDGGGGSGAFAWWANNVVQAAGAGGANTGGGGGGAVGTYSATLNRTTAQGGAGGSGIVCFRDAQELPELAGTWVLNERLYATETKLTETVNVSNGGSNYTKISIDPVTNKSLTLLVGVGGKTLYYFNNNTWEVTDHTLTFPAGATASDEFRAWLASNATKQ